MQVHYDILCLPEFHNAVITIGSFDGVHLGHRQILQQLKETAEKIQGTDILITFYPHPKKIVANDNYSIRLLNTLDEKIELLRESGLSHLVVVPFSTAFASMDADAYVSEFLVRYFHPHTIITGYDHRFGNNRSGDIQLLKQLSTTHQYEVKEIEEYLIQNNSISSTVIRKALQSGFPERAAELLGYSYFFSGTVIAGAQNGRKLGYPTANLLPEDPEKLIPGNGVYLVAVETEENNTEHYGMMNIGNRPTFEGNNTSIEVHLFDFYADLYDKQLRITAIKKMRDEIKFNSLSDLTLQLKEDEQAARILLASGLKKV